MNKIQHAINLICIFTILLASFNLINLTLFDNVLNESASCVSQRFNSSNGSQVPTKDEKEIIYDKPYYDLIVENYPGGKIYKKFLDGHIEIVNK